MLEARELTPLRQETGRIRRSSLSRQSHLVSASTSLQSPVLNLKLKHGLISTLVSAYTRALSARMSLVIQPIFGSFASPILCHKRVSSVVHSAMAAFPS
jgi:hypothetical protein